MKRVLPEASGPMLEGFNNLTKALRINLYLLAEDAKAFTELLRKHKAVTLEAALRDIAACIEALVLASSQQDYQPWGASALMLLSDAGPAAVHMHLNKSHLCAHTYPDAGHKGERPSLRVDLDLASCGTISPLRALDFILDRFEPTAALVDYSIRGFTRDADGRMQFQDHAIDQLQAVLLPGWCDIFEVYEDSCTLRQTWQMKLLRRNLNPEQKNQLRTIMQLKG